MVLAPTMALSLRGVEDARDAPRSLEAVPFLVRQLADLAEFAQPPREAERHDPIRSAALEERYSLGDPPHLLKRR